MGFRLPLKIKHHQPADGDYHLQKLKSLPPVVYHQPFKILQQTEEDSLAMDNDDNNLLHTRKHNSIFDNLIYNTPRLPSASAIPFANGVQKRIILVHLYITAMHLSCSTGPILLPQCKLD